LATTNRRDNPMIVIGADTHKRTHTLAAVFDGNGQVAGQMTVAAREPAYPGLVAWARELDAERVWAIEDCRHVSAGLERFLVDVGERVVRVPPKMMGESRAGERVSGKSDPIDALAIARAALREGPETLPPAHLDEDAMEMKLLLDHREDLVGARTEDQNRLRWHLHALWPEFELPLACLKSVVWQERVARKLARADQTARVRVARELVTEIRRRTRKARELEREITALVEVRAPELLTLHGCGALTAAKLIAETGGAKRFATDAKFARLAGVAPVPASSGKRVRYRLDRGGNRQLNCALHRIAVTQGKTHEPAQMFLARKQAEGKSRREALRCLKRHLARRVWQLLVQSEIERSRQSVDPQRDLLAPQIPAMA
jgi:transposase